MSNRPITDPQKFAGDIFWVAASNFAVPLVGLITLPAMTKNYADEVYAVWMQSILAVGLLAFIVSLYLGYSVVRFLAAEDDKAVRRRALGAILWPTLAVSSLSIVISILLRQCFSQILFGNSDYAYLVPLVFIWSAAEAVFSILVAYLLARRRIKAMSIIQIGLAVYRMAVIVILATLGYGLAWIIGFVIAGIILAVIVIFWMIVKEVGCPLPAIKGLNGYLALSIPLIPSGIFFWVISASDRFFITNILSLSQTAIYAASFAIGSLIFFFYYPIQLVLLPVLSRLWEQKESAKVRNYLEYSNKLFVTVAIPSAAGLFVLSQPILAILTTPDYLAGGGLVLLIALATILNGLYQINCSVIFLVKQTRWLMPIIATAAIANVGLNLALIPLLGVTGAAIAAVIAYLILSVTITVWARKVTGFTVSIKFMVKVVVGALLMAGIVSFIQIGGILGIIAVAAAGVIIFALWMWLTRAFVPEDIKLIREIAAGLRQGTLLR